MPITQTCISRGKTILASYSSNFGNFDEIISEVLKKSNNDNRNSYKYKEAMLNYIIVNNIAYICITDLNFNRRLSFKYLEYVANEFEKKYGQLAQTALAFSMNSEFGRYLKIYMEHFNNDIERLENIEENVDHLTAALKENIHKAIQRSERLEQLESDTSNLAAGAVNFNRTSQRVRRHFYFRNMKMTIIIVIGVSLILAITIGLIVWDVRSKN